MQGSKARHTLFAKVIRLLVHDTRWPPLRLGLFRVAGSTRGGSWGSLSTVVWVADLLAGLDELDECLGDHAAVELLEVLQSTLVVVHDLLGVSNAERYHLA